MIGRLLQQRLRVIRFEAHPECEISDGVHVMELAVNGVSGDIEFRTLSTQEVGQGAATLGAFAGQILQGPLAQLAAFLTNGVLNPPTQVSLRSGISRFTQQIRESDIGTNVQAQNRATRFRVVSVEHR
eukprot:7379282-Prymnesium_polylepis.1